MAVLICEFVFLPLIVVAVRIRRPHVKRIKELIKLEEEDLKRQKEKDSVFDDEESDIMGATFDESKYSDFSYSVK